MINSKKEKFNISLPPELIVEFERIADRFGDKAKWKPFSAAVLMLLSASDNEQNEWAARAADADNRGIMAQLIAEAKSKRLSIEIAKKAAALDRAEKKLKS